MALANGLNKGSPYRTRATTSLILSDVASYSLAERGAVPEAAEGSSLQHCESVVQIHPAPPIISASRASMSFWNPLCGISTWSRYVGILQQGSC